MNSITEDKQEECIRKCKELKFNIEEGKSSLYKEFARFNTLKSFLEGTIKDNELARTPRIIQKKMSKIKKGGDKKCQLKKYVQ